MIAEIGLAALWLAAGLAALQAMLTIFALRSKLAVAPTMRGDLARTKAEARLRRMSA